MMLSSIMKDNMFPLALMGVLDFRGLCTIDPSPSPPSTLEEMFKYGGLRNSCSILRACSILLRSRKNIHNFHQGSIYVLVCLCFYCLQIRDDVLLLNLKERN